ncbi:MAG: hypothetical protein K2K69_03265 [Muribaculaceae bacterium]|nr:hypothetical protein [Muribaculaceae bacterium]
MARKQHLIASIAGVIVAAIAGTVAMCWRTSEPQPQAEMPREAIIARIDSAEAALAERKMRSDSVRDSRRAARKKSTPRRPQERHHLDEPIPSAPR